jgi:iron complex transport system substrate-binding protein
VSRATIGRRAGAGVCVAATIAVVTASAVHASQQQTSLTDQRGRTFAFPRPAHRVVTIAIPLFWTFMTVDDGGARVVGANSVAQSQMRDGIAGRVFPGAAKITTAITRGGTFTPNVEALLALKPDAVFQWADRGDALIDVLDRAGLRALGVKNTNSESDIDTWVRMSGVVSGKQARADSLIQWMQRGNRRFDSLTASIAPAARPRVLMLTEYSRVITANGPMSYGAKIIERAGGRNAASTDGTVGIEQVLAWNPDVILLTAFETKRPADLIADPRWATTSAAQHRRVYKLPFSVTRWGGYGPESPLFLTWLADLLHPDRFNLPLRAEMRDAYRSLYRYEATDADIDRVLQMNDNATSANYGKFARTPSR